jgi:hypothetical protein
VESLPGFVGWITDSQEARDGERLPFRIGCWGLRRSAAFDHELHGAELERALQVLDQIPKEYDPIAEMRIEVWKYFLVAVDVSALHLAPPARTAKIYRLLDPTARMGGVGLANMAVSRACKAFVSVNAARALVDELTGLGLACQLEEREAFVTPDILCENERTLEREVARRRANGGELVEMACPDRFAFMFDGYDV